jgi:glycosyltransferase involved in cell wall biosynthesis
MRIGLNLLPVRPGIGGSWNYLHALIAALSEYDHDNEYVVFVTPASAPMVPRQPNFKAVELRVPTASRPLRVLFETTLFRLAVHRARLDCLHHTFGTLPLVGKTASVVTMLDLMEFHRPDDVGVVKRAYLRVMRRRVAAHATLLAPISHATANDLHRRLNVPWSRMQIVPPCIESLFSPQTKAEIDSFRARRGLSPAFWLVVADNQPHKNYARLIAAFAQLRRDHPAGWPLVVRGEPSHDLVALLEKHGVADRVTFVPRMPVGEMPLLYGAASALVFPSLFEGGGLPVLEAMACGCPVVASDIPTTREFGADAVLTFDPMNANAIAAAMQSCEESSALRAQQVERGLVAVSTLRPDVVALACLTAYRRACAMASLR